MAATAVHLVVVVSCAGTVADFRIAYPDSPGVRLDVGRRLEELQIDGQYVTASRLILDAGPHEFKLVALKELDFGAGVTHDARLVCQGAGTLREGAAYDLRSRVQKTRIQAPREMKGRNWSRNEFVVEILDDSAGDRVALIPCERNLACTMQGHPGGKTVTMNCDAFEKKLREFK